MKKILASALLLFLIGCTTEQTEEFVFRKVLEYQLKEECGADNKQCIAHVEEQIQACMNESDWRAYLENEEDEEELQRFIKAFFPCFKDDDGNAYFPLNQA